MRRSNSLFNRVNLCFIGAPGSGKGSYGKSFAERLAVPLITVSSVLREVRPDLDLHSGELVDCKVVSDSLEQYLRDKNRGYILDGFPRTRQQLDFMQSHWSEEMQVHAAILLDVPDEVCETKLLGRRLCEKCGGNYNVNAVVTGKWNLPEYLPDSCPHPGCDPDRYWKKREDDQHGIIQERLKIHHSHMDPIQAFFDKDKSLFRYTPYNGYDDVPAMLDSFDVWLKKFYRW
jgi:adenylate kinase